MGSQQRVSSGTIYLLSAIFLWGTAYRAHAVGAEHVPPAVFAALRVVPAAVLLTAFVVVARRADLRTHFAWAGLTGLLMVTVTLGGVSEAIPRAGPGTTAIIFNSYPFLVLILGRWILHERMSSLGIAGLVVGFVGLIMLISGELGPSSIAASPGIGMLIAGAVAIGWGGGTIIVTWLVRRHPQLDLASFTATQHAVGGVALAALAVPHLMAGGIDWSATDLWMAVSWASIGASAIATLAFFAALKRMTAARAATWQFLVPTVAVLVEAARGDVPTGITLIGIILTIVGVAIVNFSPSAEPIQIARQESGAPQSATIHRAQ